MSRGNSEVHVFLRSVAAGMRPASELDEISDVLVANWFDTKESLRSITIEECSYLKIPKRLFDVIQKALSEETAGGGGEHVPSTESVRPLESGSRTAAREKSAKSPEEEKEEEQEEECDVDLEPPNPEIWPWASIGLLDELKNIKEIQTVPPEECLHTLLKLIDNVLADPTEKKHRKIRLSNAAFHRKVGAHPSALFFLNGVGFVEEETKEFLVMPRVFMSRMTDARSSLAMTLAEIGDERLVPAPPLTAGKFNPYQSNLSTSRPDCSKLAGMCGTQSPADLLKAQKVRELELQTGGAQGLPPLDLAKRIFSPNANPRLLPLAVPEPAEDVQEAGGPAISSAELERLKGVMSGGSTFKSAARARLRDLETRPLFNSCIIRIKAPDRSTLQLQFRPQTKIKDVMAVIVNQGFSKTLTSALTAARAQNPTASLWYLCETPPVRRLDPEKSLYQESLVPSGTIHVNFSQAVNHSAPYFE